MQTENQVRNVLIAAGVDKWLISVDVGSFSPKGIHIRFDDLPEEVGDISSLEMVVTDKGIFFPVV